MKTKITEINDNIKWAKDSEDIPFGFFMGTIGTHKNELFVKIPTEYGGFSDRLNETIPLETGSLIISLSPSGKSYQNIWDHPVMVDEYRAVTNMDITVNTRMD